MRFVALAVLAVLFATQRVSADAAADEARLRARLDPETSRAVSELLRASRAAGLPTQPLVGCAFEGASRGASGTQIVAAVREQAGALATAREALGAASTSTELVAGSMALLAGASSDSLERLRILRPKQSLVVPLVVLSDWIARRVPIEAASSTMLTAARAGLHDAQFLQLRERIDRELDRGAAPKSAMATGLRLMLGEGGHAAASTGSAHVAPSARGHGTP